MGADVGGIDVRILNRAIVATDELAIHPADAGELGLYGGELVRVRIRWGETQAPARLSSHMTRGTAFLSSHNPDTHTNRPVGPHIDPPSRCPDYKVTAVRLTPAQGF